MEEGEGKKVIPKPKRQKKYYSLSDPHYIFFPTLISRHDWAAMLAFDLRGETLRREPDLRRAVTLFGN